MYEVVTRQTVRVEEGWAPGPKAPSRTEVVWGGKSGWRIKLTGDLAPGPTPAVFSRAHNRRFWDAMVEAGVIVPALRVITMDGGRAVEVETIPVVASQNSPEAAG